MSSKFSLPLLLFLFLNLLFFGLVVSSSDCDSPPKHSSIHKHKHHNHKSNSPTSPPMSFSNPPMQYPPKLPPRFPLPSSPPSTFPGTPKLSPGFPLPSSPPFAFPGTPKLPPAFPLPRVSPPLAFPNSRKSGTCPRDAIRFGVCAKVLGGLLGAEIGTPPKKPCCRLFGGLVEAEAAVCLCTAIKANVLGFNLNVPVSLGLVLNVCDMKTPPGFQCS